MLGRQPSYWLMIQLFGLGISGSLGIYTMLPLFMVNAHGFERDFANTLLAVSRVPGVLAAFGSGWFTDRFGPKRTILGVLLLNGLLTMALGWASTDWLPYLVFLQPALAVCFFPAGFAAIGSVAPPGARNKYAVSGVKKALGWPPDRDSDTKENYRKRSSLSFGGNSNIPILVVHGERDKFVPFEHATALNKEAEKHEKKIQFKPVGGWLRGNHFLIAGNDSVWEAVMEFLEKNI